MAVKRGLGKGIDALITSGSLDSNENDGFGRVMEIEISQIEPNPGQPRQIFREEELAGLADSIRQYGIISPVIVKKEKDYYSIIAGERRWRAARLAGLSSVPVVVREYDGLESLHVALIENLQRAELNPLEEAVAYRKLIEQYDMTQELIAEKIGKSRSSVANTLRLLNLSSDILEHLQENRLSQGHAKVLLSLTDTDEREALAEKIVSDGLSVRETEKAAQVLSNAKDRKKGTETKKPAAGFAYGYLEKELSVVFGTKVGVKAGKSGDRGKIEIEFFSKDELDRLYLLLKSLI